MNAIEVHDLRKDYGGFEALRGVDLQVRTGSLFGLLGPNGAGKSTLIKALVGALRPSSGQLSVLGIDPLREPARLRAQIGYMPQSPALYEDLSARENVLFFASAHSSPDPGKRVEEVLAFADLSERADDPVHTFSGGMKRRVSLACALVHQPRVLFLDEPTAAVDPHLRGRFWRTFRDLAASGVTLFISTHLMDEALLCDEVAILRQGSILVTDTPQGLLQRGRSKLTLRCGSEEREHLIESRPEDLAHALRAYGLSPEVRGVEIRADTLETVVLGLIGEETAP